MDRIATSDGGAMARGEIIRVERGWFVRLGELATKDRACRLDPYLVWARKPATALALAGATSLACGLFIHPRALILGAGIAAVLAIGAVWPWLSVLGLTGELSFAASRAREGVPISARLIVRNGAFWDAWGLTIRETSEAGAIDAPGMTAAPGRRTTEATWHVVFDRRGVHPESTPNLTCGFPFGLFNAARPLATSTRVVVWPATFPVGAIPEAAGSRESDGVAVAPRAGTMGDHIGVRPYRRGDSIRRVHWPQSARHGTLIVCELESRATPEVQVVIDVHPDAHAGAGRDGSLEWAVRVAASFAEDWIGKGADVELVFGGTTVPAAAGPVATRKATALDALARLQTDDSRTLSEVLAGPSCSRRPSGLRVVVATDRSDRATTAWGSGPAERFVVLAAGGFAGGAGPVGPPEPRPWIWIDGPVDVAGQVGRCRKEAGHDR